MTDRVGIIKVDELAAFSADKYSRVLIGGAKGLLRLLCFEPGQAVSLHTHPQGDEYFLVVKGRGRVQVGSEEADVEQGSIVRAPAGTPHQWRAGSERLVLLSVLIPPLSYELADDASRMAFV